MLLGGIVFIALALLMMNDDKGAACEVSMLQGSMQEC